MKYLVYFGSLMLLFISCQRDADVTTVEQTEAALVAKVLSQQPSVELSESLNKGLYKGIFASYDLVDKGMVFLNLQNDGNVEAAVRFVKGKRPDAYFVGNQDVQDSNTYHFKSELGSFTATVSSGNDIQIKHFNFTGRDHYISAFKSRSLADVTVAFGTYVDDADPSFAGNWDAIHAGSLAPAPPGHSNSNLMLLDKVVISKQGNMFTSTDTPSDNDSFVEPCFYGSMFPQAWFYESDNNSYREFIGYNQTTTFANRMANWSLSYYVLDGIYSYDTPVCNSSEAAGYGSWSWDGRSGRLRVDSLSDL
ncbi:hypothetical protein [Cochleicola gelatinilyticus]|uniref:DUF5689 domain-containing protein n=1 Tax=Cochleicola gelatinilyticus TaxID=1763537 RepID=A0A167IUR1_9FLAO|nr:hypothetical protein [Cochleicola gelatinilyticus]OAB80034.1 hypothetical protein ULVI_04650 [Cochleicola gelatinilyticus]